MLWAVSLITCSGKDGSPQRQGRYSQAAKQGRETQPWRVHQLRDSTHSKGEHSEFSLSSVKGEHSGFSLSSAKEEHSGLSLRSAKGYICFNIFVSQRSILVFFLFWKPPSLCSTGCPRTLSMEPVSLKLKVVQLPLPLKSWN